MKRTAYALLGALAVAGILLLAAAVPSQTDFDTTYFSTNALPMTLRGNLTNWSKLSTNAASAGIAGTVINTGASTADAIPRYTDTTGTNIGPSSVTMPGGTNLVVPGKITGNLGTVSGSDATSSLELTGTWNTTGNPSALKIAITDTASGSTAKAIEVLGGAAGSTSLFGVDKSGYINMGFTAAGVKLKTAANGLSVRTGTDSTYQGVDAYGVDCYSSGNRIAFFNAAGARFASGLTLNWSPNASDVNSVDLILLRDAAATLQLGTDAASPVNQTIKFADGSGTDKNGASGTTAGGQGTGAGAGGDLIEKTSITSTTGSTAQTYSTRSYTRAKPTTLTDATATTVANITLAAGKYITIHVRAGTFATDGTDHQTTSDELTISAVNKAGTITASSPSTSLTSTAPSSGTLTTAWTLVANGAASVDLKVNADTSLTPTTLQTLWKLVINSNDPATVTPQ